MTRIVRNLETDCMQAFVTIATFSPKVRQCLTTINLLGGKEKYSHESTTTQTLNTIMYLSWLPLVTRIHTVGYILSVHCAIHLSVYIPCDPVVFFIGQLGFDSFQTSHKHRVLSQRGCTTLMLSS